MEKDISQEVVDAITQSIMFFAFGEVMPAIGTGTTYLTQLCHHEDWKRVATSFQVITIILVIIAYGLFSIGLCEAYTAFVEHLSPEI